MRVVFMGTPAFAVPTLQALVDAGHEVICVVAQPDRPKGRGKKLVSPPTIERARELGLPTRQPRAVRRGPFVAYMQGCGADVAVVVAYGRILVPAVLEAPRLGCINVHASLLPLYRGAAPIQWSVIDGHTETGVCTMQMDVGLDTGDVLMTRPTPIGPDETSGDLFERLAPLGAGLLIETLTQLDGLKPQPQDHGAHTLAPLLSKSDGVLDWTQSAAAIHARVRGVNPWPGGQTLFRAAPLKIWQTRPFGGTVAGSGAPGTLVHTKGKAVVQTGTGRIELVSVQLPGKKRVDGAAFVNGARVQLGESLGG